MKKVLVVALIGSLAFSVAGCKKHEEKAKMPAGHPSMEGGTPPEGMAAMPNVPNMPKVERAVVVPDEVASKWKSVKLTVEDKTAKTSKEYMVPVGSDLAVPNTKIKIKVLAFLPDFRMGDKDITSASDKPNNPAVQVSIEEPGKEAWKGWLFSMQPGIHPFSHEKVGVTLAGGVAK